jgi:phosphoribosylaminoimidazole-succinocarboxamide synthase
MPAGLVESQKLPQPIFTPSTKADQGEHDENIHPDKGQFAATEIGIVLTPAKEIVGAEIAEQVEKVAIKLYCKSHCAA